MNPFELQAQLARQWFDVARTMMTATMSACAAVTDQTAMLWGRSMPWQMSSIPASSFAPLPWMPAVWPAATAWPMSWNAASWSASAPLATNPWAANPIAAWMTAFSGQPAGLPTMPFATSLPFPWAPWAFGPAAAPAPWTSALSTPGRNSGTDFLEQMATNYRTASGYAVAAVMGPLNAALDPRTYGEPWWQKLDRPKKLN